MSTQTGSREFNVPRPSPRMGPGIWWFILCFVVLSYLTLVLVVLLRPSERSPFSVLCIALATLAVGAVGAAAWGFRDSGARRHLTLQARLARVPGWLAYAVLFTGLGFLLFSFISVFPRAGMGELHQPALITALSLCWLGFLCEPRALVRRR